MRISRFVPTNDAKMAEFQIFFENKGLEHIGAKILSYLDYPDLYQCREIRQMNSMVEKKLLEARKTESKQVEKWLETEGPAFLKYWPEWTSVFEHFTSHRSLLDLYSFNNLMQRYVCRYFDFIAQNLKQGSKC